MFGGGGGGGVYVCVCVGGVCVCVWGGGGAGRGRGGGAVKPVLLAQNLTHKSDAVPNYKHICSLRIWVFYPICETSH